MNILTMNNDPLPLLTAQPDLAPPYIVTLENDPNVLRRIPGGVVYPKLWVSLLCGLAGLPMPPDDFTPRGYLRGEIIHGRWLCRCAFCGEYVVASKIDRRFWCPKCAMLKNEGRPATILFPDPSPLAEIEAILLMRPTMENRNYKHGETIAQLAKENLANGCIRRLY